MSKGMLHLIELLAGAALIVVIFLILKQAAPEFTKSVLDFVKAQLMI